MNPAEITAAKEKLCGSITMMLNGFESLTGFQVTGVRIKRDEETGMIESISMKVELPE